MALLGEPQSDHTTMNDTHPSDDQSGQLEEIVAYLDGELTPQESARVERRLASDERYRRQLQGIERAWAALDELPAATVDDNFSRSTMELVVDAARSEVQHRTQALPVERRNRRLSTVLLATMAALLGALAYRVRSENPNRELLADLPVIEYIDVYSQFRSVDFLRQLHRELSESDWAGTGDEEATKALLQFRTVASPRDRTEWLESLAEDQRVSLRAKFNRFRALSGQQQERLRALYQEIASDPNAAQLQQTLLEYQQWLNGLPPSEQYELREKPADERVQRIVQMVAREAGDKAFELTPEQLETLFLAVRPLWFQMREKAQEGFSRREGNGMESARGRGELWRFVRDNAPEIRDLNLAIREALPDDVRKRYEQLSPREQWERFFRWMIQRDRQRDVERGPGGRRRRARPSEQQLEEFFVEEVDAATKERLLAMPRDRMQQVLRRMYSGNLSSRSWNKPADERPDWRRGAGSPPGFPDRRNQPHPEHGPPDRPPRLRGGPQGPPSPVN